MPRCDARPLGRRSQPPGRGRGSQGRAIAASMLAEARSVASARALAMRGEPCRRRPRASRRRRSRSASGSASMDRGAAETRPTRQRGSARGVADRRADVSSARARASSSSRRADSTPLDCAVGRPFGRRELRGPRLDQLPGLAISEAVGEPVLGGGELRVGRGRSVGSPRARPGSRSPAAAVRPSVTRLRPRRLPPAQPFAIGPAPRPRAASAFTAAVRADATASGAAPLVGRVVTGCAHTGHGEPACELPSQLVCHLGMLSGGEQRREPRSVAAVASTKPFGGSGRRLRRLDRSRPPAIERLDPCSTAAVSAASCDCVPPRSTSRASTSWRSTSCSNDRSCSRSPRRSTHGGELGVAGCARRLGPRRAPLRRARRRRGPRWPSSSKASTSAAVGSVAAIGSSRARRSAATSGVRLAPCGVPRTAASTSGAASSNAFTSMRRARGARSGRRRAAREPRSMVLRSRASDSRTTTSRSRRRSAAAFAASSRSYPKTPLSTLSRSVRVAFRKSLNRFCASSTDRQNVWKSMPSSCSTRSLTCPSCVTVSSDSAPGDRRSRAAAS